MAKHTLAIFNYLLANLPPLFPAATAEKIKNALEILNNDPRITPKAVEDTMVKFGYDLWPWNEAFKEFAALTEGRMGEQFLMAHLPDKMQKRYEEYKKYGLAWRDLYTGRAAEYFDAEERNELVIALVATKNDLARFTRREIVGLNKDKYLARVEEFKNILEKIKETLMVMRKMADEEQYHPILADEIRDRVRSFELGLCALAPSVNFDEVVRSIEFFADRKIHLNMMKGIDKAVTVEF